MYDQLRDRKIPVVLYPPAKQSGKMKVVIISHGYSQNQGSPYLSYSFIGNALAERGFFVLSIQHELPTDPLLPTTGPIYENRLPNWQRGVINIIFVINELKRNYKNLDFNEITLIGHSNGGDMSMLLAREHPDMVNKVISLDNRRVPLPRTSKPAILSFRSSDQPADEGVLPTEAGQRKFGIKVVKLPTVAHADMGDEGTEAQKLEIMTHILNFLN
jgi:pimeloyl-ACP methyl ester carboxylesterase